MTRRRYAPDEVRRALEIHAVNNGRTSTTRTMLDEAGLDVDLRTIRRWVSRDHVDLYAQIRRELEAHIRENGAERMRGLLTQAMDVSEEAMRQISEALKRGELKPTELPKALQSSMVAGGIAVDKDLIMTGNPNQIVGSRPATTDDLVRELESVGIKVILGGKPIIDVNAHDTAPAALPEHVEGADQGKDPSSTTEA